MLDESVGGCPMFGEGVGGRLDPMQAQWFAANLPIAVVDKVMTARTKQGKVVDIGGAAISPMLDVVSLAPLWRGVAADTSAISGRKHDALGQRCRPLGPAQPQRLAVGISKSGVDIGISD